MSADIKSTRCAVCEKHRAMCMCDGCKAYFCTQHFMEHRQHLSMEFDQNVVKMHDSLLEQISVFAQPNILYGHIYDEIDQWERSMILKLRTATALAREHINRLFTETIRTLTERLENVANNIRTLLNDDCFTEDDIERLQFKLEQLQRSFNQETDRKHIELFVDDKINWNRMIHIRKKPVPKIEQLLDAKLKRRLSLRKNKMPLRGTNALLNVNSVWLLEGQTVAGSDEFYNGLNQSYNLFGLYVDSEETVYVTDCVKHCVLEWRCGDIKGRVVAGGNGSGSRMDQLCKPTDVILDENTDYLLICDSGNRRVVRWPRHQGTHGETIIENTNCWGLTKDNRGYIYVTDHEESSVKRWRIGDIEAKVVAGGNGKGNRLDQLNHPMYVFVDEHYSVYVSDSMNNRVMLWRESATEGIAVAGTCGRIRLNYPSGVVVDRSGTVYVADCGNHRIMRWPKGVTNGLIFVDRKSTKNQANQLNCPWALAFDRHGSLYAVDKNNYRVQKFAIDESFC